MTGGFNRVVFEYEVENLAGVDAMMREYTNTKVRDSMKVTPIFGSRAPAN